MPCKNCRDWFRIEGRPDGECRRFPPHIYAISFVTPPQPNRLAMPQSAGPQLNVQVNTQPPITNGDYECREYELGIPRQPTTGSRNDEA